jgi:hypothetical protein
VVGDGSFSSPLNADEVTLADVAARWVDVTGSNDDVAVLTVLLYPGIYSGDGWCHVTFNRPIKIIGLSGAAFTQLRCSNLDYAIQLSHTAGTSKLKGLTFEAMVGSVDGQESQTDHTTPRGIAVRAFGGVVVDDCTFQNNVITVADHSLQQHFSLIYAEAPAHVIVSRSRFNDNIGSAIVANAVTVEIRDSTFERNRAEGGSVVRGLNGATVSMYACSVSGNYAVSVDHRGDGAALDVAGSTLQIHGSTFVGNVGHEYGAVVSATAFSTVVVTNSTFRGNALGCPQAPCAEDDPYGALLEGSCMHLVSSRLDMDGGILESNLQSALFLTHEVPEVLTVVSYLPPSTVANSAFRDNVGHVRLLPSFLPP